MKARTRTLFHFTKTLETVMRILKEGFWPKYSLEDTAWIDPRVPRLAWPMVSFCDIPISRLREHTDFYGSYGIGLCRQSWKPYGLNPLLYVSPESMLIRELSELLLTTTTSAKGRIRTCANVLLAHCKRLEGVAVRNGESCHKDFYAECEWRFLPWVEGAGGENTYGFFLTEPQFQDENTRNEANEERRKQMPTVAPDDVRYLLVKTREDVRELIACIENMEHRSHVEKDMLKTRILLLDEISDDL